MPAQIELTGVSKTYCGNGLAVQALQGIDTTIEKTEFTVLAGPSGSGKSTLLHLIGALDQATTGKVSVAGLDLSSLSQKALATFRLRHIGFVFQAYNLIPVLTAKENVEYTLLLQGANTESRTRRSLELLEKVGLTDQQHKRPGEMSGGQQQRVAVARALASQPDIVLADEPTANLDSHNGTTLIDLFHQLNRQYQTTFVFASHDPMVIERAGRVICLRDGHIEKDERK